MKIIQINLESISQSDINTIVLTIKSGLTVVFPTDTCYGIAVNPQDQTAVKALYDIKNRPTDKSISCIFRDIPQIRTWAKLNNLQQKILQKNLPGAFTFILDANNQYPIKSPDGIKMTTVGARIPNFEFTKMLAGILQIPYTATSANISGRPSCYKVEDFLEQIKSINGTYPDLIVDAGELPQNPPSTVVDLTKQKPVIVRQGSGIFQR